MGCIQCIFADAHEPTTTAATEAFSMGTFSMREGPSAETRRTRATEDFSGEVVSYKVQRSREAGAQLLENLLQDESIISARIQSKDIKIRQFLNQGAYAEVYTGLYNGRKVAIKTLLEETRRNMNHVEMLLAEVKLMITMEHPHIVPLLGVAWDTLTDLRVVFEYMEGGDLKSLLAYRDAEDFPEGLDHVKLTIARDVADALTYLHSFNPPVLYQNLKAKTILLSAELDAKITSFGGLRVRMESRINAESDLLLYTAPEVLMGGIFTTEADVYSLGMLLAQLDRHTLPISEDNNVILELVASGELNVEFSSSAGRSIVGLGLACLSLNPEDRPTAAEVAYNLRNLLQHEASESNNLMERSEVI